MKFEDLKFDFDDIKLPPKIYTDINSRSGISPYYPTGMLPIIAAPMDTVVDLTNYHEYQVNHIPAALPRTVDRTKMYGEHIAPFLFHSFGLDEINNMMDRNLHFSSDYILIDIANGHMQKLKDAAVRFKVRYPSKKIMVGNIGNPETYKWYADTGVIDFIRVGIGNGNGCLTTKQTAIGYPMGSLISECFLIKNKLLNKKNKDTLPKIVADGGMKDYSDVIKSLALGADYVMIGSIFNKALESSGQNYLHMLKINRKLAAILYHKGFTIRKQYYGMSTKIAQRKMGKTKLKTSEGVVRYRNVEYTLSGWVENFISYLTSAMSYSGAKNLDEFVGKAEKIFITRNAFNRFNK